ncbi:hypothetical protein M407DRAFT_20281 [Tulasnella calospora MUT 4182]|uniref:Uncharacterized protein n=1 Tax=Tulasnella calospora MUT 4182 TaxID=1051891 RepID=A0A0C3QQG6_9AGAM|nr:hypothetical protein M407DRAFT_20281 [Tulasnella calospora MUT 4182]
MRSISLSGLTILLATAATVRALLPEAAPFSINPDPSQIDLKIIPKSSGSPTIGMTTAKRFKMNLPPLKPKLRRHAGVRVTPTPRPSPSVAPRTTRTCNILVQNVDDNTTVGFISPAWNGFGEYGTFQQEQAGALEVSFSYPQGDLSPSQLDFTAANGPSSEYPLFSGSIGFASTSLSLGSGSYDYAYIDGTTQIPAGSTPAGGENNAFTATTGINSEAESAIWMYDPVTQEITVQWTNPDGSTPPNYIVYANDENQALIITGDVAALRDTFGAE